LNAIAASTSHAEFAAKNARKVRDRAVLHDLVDDCVPAVRGLDVEHRQR